MKFARFADENGKITRGCVKPKLFEPDSNNILSVFNVSNFDDLKKCKFGYSSVAKPKKRKLYGWAELEEADFKNTDLRVDQDDNPQGHANVTGWSARQQERKNQAQLLAMAANKAAGFVRLDPTVRKCSDCESQNS